MGAVPWQSKATCVCAGTRVCKTEQGSNLPENQGEVRVFVFAARIQHGGRKQRREPKCNWIDITLAPGK